MEHVDICRRVCFDLQETIAKHNDLLSCSRLTLCLDSKEKGFGDKRDEIYEKTETTPSHLNLKDTNLIPGLIQLHRRTVRGAWGVHPPPPPKF